MKANIREAQRRVDAALEEYEAAKAEVAWWQDGLRLVDPKAASMIDAPQDAEVIVTELFPDPSVFRGGAQPTLRQAIVLVMREIPARRWSINELTTALAHRGWLPERDDAAKRVSDLAGEMVRLGQLARVNRGIYALPPDISAALDAERGRQE